MSPVRVLVAIPKGRPWMHGFVLSLLMMMQYEHLNKNISLAFSLADLPFEVSEFNPQKYARIAKGREQLVKDAISGNFDYIWFLDDDMEFPPNSLRRLLSYKKDFVSGLAFMKKSPFFPTQFKTITTRNKKTGEIKESYYHILDYGDEVSEVDGVGLFNALIKVEAIKKLREPYFSSPELDLASHIGEDISFCRRMWEAGFKIYVDPNLKCGHLLNDKEEITEMQFKQFLKQADPALIKKYQEGKLNVH